MNIGVVVTVMLAVAAMITVPHQTFSSVMEML